VVSGLVGAALGDSISLVLGGVWVESESQTGDSRRRKKSRSCRSGHWHHTWGSLHRACCRDAEEGLCGLRKVAWIWSWSYIVVIVEDLGLELRGGPSVFVSKEEVRQQISQECGARKLLLRITYLYLPRSVTACSRIL
jgi:hypothetical protein